MNEPPDGKIRPARDRILHMADMTLPDLEEFFGLLEELLPQVR